ncbi:VUT family protein [Legionella sp. CNM-4043-24]|uniref:VUT family protein n=1 Tax=Legionella sp. CNM-4043-24 TaxID=3421646 RepID=UPI00403B349E
MIRTASSVTASIRCYPVSIAMTAGLALLVNTSFKLIAVMGLVFSASSLLCPLITGLYLWMLTTVSPIGQRHILNQALLALYLFSIGIYLLLNLPAAEGALDNLAYQIVFDDLPRKFFASTLAFALSFYLPHAYFFIKQTALLQAFRGRLLIALTGGLVFFTLNFFLLFTSPRMEDFDQIYLDSLLLASFFLLIIGILYFLCVRPAQPGLPAADPSSADDERYQYLVSFAVIMLLVCLACEYRLVSFTSDMTLAASSILLPLLMMISTVVGERFGYQASKRLILVLLSVELIFDALLMLVVLLPSPEFYDLDSFYHLTLPRRIPAATLAIILAFGSNAWLQEFLKKSLSSQALRLFVANTAANSLLCLVTYTILFSGVYPAEQIVDLAINAWIYKMLLSVLGLPLILWACRRNRLLTAWRVKSAPDMP